MTNNTIPSVPRELLDSLLTVIESNGYAADEVEVVDELRAILSAPSPAGVDGLNTDRNAAFKACPESGCDWGSFYLGWKARGEVEQAIIDGMRGEVAELESTLADNLELSGKRAVRIAEIGHEFADAISERDQQAQRIGELEGLLRHAQKQVPTGSGLHTRIDAALSAGKEGE